MSTNQQQRKMMSEPTKTPKQPKAQKQPKPAKQPKPQKPGHEPTGGGGHGEEKVQPKK